MTRLLADRIEQGVIPMGYVIAGQLLRYDCEVTGVSGFTGEPMPAEVTDGVPPAMYAIFDAFQAPQLARGAFGNEFADQVQAFRDQVNARASGQ
jgi:hypothetical protein